MNTEETETIEELESGIAVQTELTGEALQKQINDWQSVTRENLGIKNQLMSLSFTLESCK